MNKKYVMGIDNGGTLAKAAIYDSAGHVISLQQERLKNLSSHPLWTERDIESTWTANISVIRKCLDTPGVSAEDIVGIGLTGHGNGIYFARKDGSAPYNGIISTDGRAQSYVDNWLADPQYPTRIRAKTGSTVFAGQPVALLAWIDDNMPELFNQVDYIMSAKDYIRFRLTGIATMDTSDGCGVNWADLAKRELDPDLWDFYGVTRWMSKVPPFCESTDVAGYVTDRVADQTGLLTGTPVAGGLMDICAGAVAAGVIEENELAVITGTWSINEVISGKLNFDTDVFLSTTYPISGTYLILEGSPNGVTNLDWFINRVLRELFAAFTENNVSDDHIFATCDRLIAEYKPTVDDPLFLPFINGTDLLPEGRAGFVGLMASHSATDMVRAVYEGVVFSHILHIDKLRKYGDVGDHIRFTGGAANSKVWMQMFADATGLPLHVVDAVESGTLGAAICAAVAVGVHPEVETAIKAMTKDPREIVMPNLDNSKLYAARYERFINVLTKFGYQSK